MYESTRYGRIPNLPNVEFKQCGLAGESDNSYLFLRFKKGPWSFFRISDRWHHKRNDDTSRKFVRETYTFDGKHSVRKKIKFNSHKKRPQGLPFSVKE